MTARTTLETTTKTASQTQINTVVAAETTRQETVNQSGVNTSSIPATLVNGNATFVAAR